MSPSSSTVEVIDSLDLRQENIYDTSSTKDANKTIANIMRSSQRQAVSEKLEKPILKYFDEEIWNVIIDCHENNWDGYGAKEISDDSIAKAREFCFNVQASEILSKPYMSVDIDGYVMFTWQFKQDILSIIVQPNDKIIFSLIFGSERLNGMLPFYQGKIPSLINEKLKELSAKCQKNN
jgi:hypothetical protein